MRAHAGRWADVPCWRSGAHGHGGVFRGAEVRLQRSLGARYCTRCVKPRCFSAMVLDGPDDGALVPLCAVATTRPIRRADGADHDPAVEPGTG